MLSIEIKHLDYITIRISHPTHLKQEFRIQWPSSNLLHDYRKPMHDPCTSQIYIRKMMLAKSHSQMTRAFHLKQTRNILSGPVFDIVIGSSWGADPDWDKPLRTTAWQSSGRKLKGNRLIFLPQNDRANMRQGNWPWAPNTTFNSLWPSEAIWRQRSGSTMAQVMACCLTAPSHYLNKCWLIISEAKWHSFKCNSTRDTSNIYH